MRLQRSEEIKSKLKAILDATEKPFPAFSGDEKKAYDAISNELKPYGLTDPRAEVYPPQQPSILENAKRPEEIPQGAWDKVIKQLRTEFVYRQSCHQLFKLLDAWILSVYISNLSYLNQAVQLAQATRNEEGELVFKGLIKVGLATMGSLPVQFIGVAVALVEIVIDWAASSESISSGAVAGTISKLHTQLEKDFQGCRTTARSLELRILNRWGSLEPMGKAQLSGQIQWPSQEDKMTEVALRQFKISLWQILLPAVWYIMRPQNDPTAHPSYSQHWHDNYLRTNPQYFLSAIPSGKNHLVSFRWLGRGSFVLGHQDASPEMCEALFETLKIPRADVFLEQNGWKGFYKQRLTECAGTAVAALMTASEHPAGPPEEHLTLLRKLRTELKGSPMGSWYLSVYDEIAPQVLKLYETDDRRSIACAIKAYGGKDIYDALVKTLQGQAGVSSKQQDDLLAILVEVINTSVRLLGQNNAVQRRTTAVLPRLAPYAGKTYVQVLQMIGKEQPPQL